jgi:methylphosphotriester-DNA--protein-cysteine methyltransferase
MSGMNEADWLARAFHGDSSLDGLFVVGVRSTRIYCRPSCKPPRIPKLEQRRFYHSPFEAEEAGFRACKLCRPNSLAPIEREAQIVTALLEHALSFVSVSEMAIAAHVSPAKLYRLFKVHRGVTPAEVLNRKRVEAACQYLEQNQQSVSEIALEVGFNSLSAFNANFKRLMQVPPLEYRRLRSLL